MQYNMYRGVEENLVQKQLLIKWEDYLEIVFFFNCR